MQTISDNKKQLDLNPRQFYIILREDNKQYHKLYKEIAEASENDEIRFCIIDTTETKENLLERTVLYQRFMGEDVEGGPWDFIIRNYPDDGNFSFSCYHIVSDDENDIKKKLNRWRNDKEREMWEKITKTFCGYFANNTSSRSKIREFFDTIDEILLSKGVPTQELDAGHDNLGCHLELYNGDESIKLVKNFVDGNISVIDIFFNLKTSREKSDEYMRCFFETGGYIAKPKLEIEKIGNIYNGNVHDKYRLKVTTASGENKYPIFPTVNSFAMYVFFMFRNCEHIYKKDFYLSNKTNEGKEKAKENCEEFLAIYAAITDGIGGDPNIVITNDNGKVQDDNTKIRKVISDLKNLSEEKDNFWRNANVMNTLLKVQLGEDEAEPFLIKTVEGEKRRREYYLDFNPDDLDCDDKKLNDDIKDNKSKIKKLNIFNTDNENTL